MLPNVRVDRAIPLHLNPSQCMNGEPPVPSISSTSRGLPPVTPPSGRFIMQLFLVPGLIVAVVVAIVVGIGYLVSGTRTTDHFLRALDSSNADIRWRGAHELSQILQRPESLALASDPKFALDLAERLRLALAEVEQAEKATADRTRNQSTAEKEAAWRGLAAQRNQVIYLTASLGDFTVPVGIPVLSKMALQEAGPDVKGGTQRRRLAVFALGKLGENFKRRYLGLNALPGDKVLTDAQKEAIVEALKKEASGNSDRPAWAHNALAYMVKQTPTESFKPIWVDQTLEQCAKAEDPILRSLVAQALNFWDGARVEPTLLRLARDDGHGPRIEIDEND